MVNVYLLLEILFFYGLVLPSYVSDHRPCAGFTFGLIKS